VIIIDPHPALEKYEAIIIFPKIIINHNLAKHQSQLCRYKLKQDNNKILMENIT
jgi:hypothetical protein